MIDGTRPYRKKNLPPSPPVAEVSGDSSTEKASPDAANLKGAPATRTLDRRAWFSSLVPAFGAGLVEILRTSNNLQRDISELMEPTKARSEK